MSARTHSDGLGCGIGRSGLASFCGNADVRDTSVEYEPDRSLTSASTEWEILDVTTCLEQVLGGGVNITGGSLHFGSGFEKGSSTPRRIRYWRAQVGRVGSTDWRPGVNKMGPDDAG